MPTSTEVVGVDGCRGGWIAVLASGRRTQVMPCPTFADVLSLAGARRVGVDMPLPPFPPSMAPPHRRRSDIAAREFLGSARSSIFWTPSAELIQRWRADPVHPRGAGISVQAWNLVGKIAEVADALAARPQTTVREVHPECSFRAMAPGVELASKKTAAGREQRRAAVAAWAELEWPTPGVPARFGEDVLDAAAVAWTMQRHLRGFATTLPPDPGLGEPTITV